MPPNNRSNYLTLLFPSIIGGVLVLFSWFLGSSIKDWILRQISKPKLVTNGASNDDQNRKSKSNEKATKGDGGIEQKKNDSASVSATDKLDSRNAVAPTRTNAVTVEDETEENDDEDDGKVEAEVAAATKAFDDASRLALKYFNGV